MDTINEYKETIYLFGKKREVTITIKVEPDPDAINIIEDCDDSISKKALKDYENGKLSVDIIFVEVKCDLFNGNCSLGGCMIYLNSTHDHENEAECYEMIDLAIDDYRENAQKYKDFFEA